MLRLGMAGALVVSLGIAVLSFSTYGQASALLGHRGCYHDLYFERQLRPKVAVIGSSRIRRGLDPTVMAEGIGHQEGAVVNLGHPLSLPLYDYSVLSGMFADGRLGEGLELLLIEAIPISEAQLTLERRGAGQTPSETLTISSGPVREGFVSGGSASALLELARHQDPGVAMTAWNMMRMVGARIETHIKLALRGRSTVEVLSVESDIDQMRDTICFAARWHQAEEGGAREIAKKTHYKTHFEGKPATGAFDPNDFLDNPFFTAQRLGLRRVVDLARAHGVRVSAFYLQGVHTPDVPERFLARFEAEIGMPLLTLPADLRAELGDEKYFDHTHLGASGRQLVSQWLARAIKDDLSQ